MIKYMLSPVKKLNVNPNIIDRITANTEPRTENIPFTPYIHGIYLMRSLFFNICIPVGKGIPRKNPKGNNKMKETIARKANP